MLQIRDVMTRDVLTVTPEMTLREAAELFARRHVSGAPVVHGERVVGVVSATDLLEFVASSPGASPRGETPREEDEWGRLPAREVEDLPPAAYYADLGADSAADVDERFADSGAEGGSATWNVLDEHTVDEVMTREVCSLTPHLPIAAAAEYMRTAGVHRVLVLDGERLAGIITSSDVTRAVAEHKLGEGRLVFDRSVPARGRDAGAR